MPTIRIVNNLEGQQANIFGKTVTLERHSITEIDVEEWLELKKILCIQIESGFIYPESADYETEEIKKFIKTLNDHFESLGVPKVKAEIESGSLSNGVKKQEASEWLLRKEAEFASKTQAITESNASNQLRWAIWAVVIAVFSLAVSERELIIEAIFSNL